MSSLLITALTACSYQKKADSQEDGATDKAKVFSANALKDNGSEIKLVLVFSDQETGYTDQVAVTVEPVDTGSHAVFRFQQSLPGYDKMSPDDGVTCQQESMRYYTVTEHGLSPGHVLFATAEEFLGEEVVVKAQQTVDNSFCENESIGAL